MLEGTRLEAVTDERLTWAETCARYPGEWVTLVDADWVDEDYVDFRTAVVLVHSADYASSFPGRELSDRFDESIHLFTGRPGAPATWAR
jgi:hypothetical protein